MRRMGAVAALTVLQHSSDAPRALTCLLCLRTCSTPLSAKSWGVLAGFCPYGSMLASRTGHGFENCQKKLSQAVLLKTAGASARNRSGRVRLGWCESCLQSY